MKVHILFGDEPRTDGENVLGVFYSYEEAEDFAEKYFPECYYSISMVEVSE